jgi:plasmid stabilization system protein ParE
MKAIWSEEASLTFADIINNISNRFTEREANVFLEQTFSTIDAIENYPKLYPTISVKGLKNVHKAIIHPHSTLFYEIGNNHIELLFFWDNRDNPDKLK